MEDLKLKMIFLNYYNAILGGFYSSEEKERILRLIAISSGIGNYGVSEVIEATEYIEKNGIDNPVGSKNFLLIAFFVSNLSPVIYNAAVALNEIYSTNKGSEGFSNEILWHRTILTENKPIEIGYYQYARKKLDHSIEAFERLKRSNKKLPLNEYLAYICREAEKYEKAYEYALEAQSIGNGERLEIPWLMEIENQARDKISKETAEKISKDILSKKTTLGKIGF